MCGRFVLTATPEELQALFGYLDGEDFPPRYNIAPTQPIAIVRMAHGVRRFALVRWGLVPGWVKNPKAFGVQVNARSETAARNNAFKGGLQYRRCLIPASGFYEWKKREGQAKQPYYLAPKDGTPLALAGIWETWMGADGSEIDSACILTTAANDTVAPIHDRMPVVIGRPDFGRWLESRDPVDDLLRPASDALLSARPVGTRVNDFRNDDPGLLAKAAPAPREAGLPLFER
ncbi:MAG TPA: SOS response-associated peptidase [Bauldia sp.]|nr:SOS response-associated peptidase [Bauldia sp.]